MVTHKTMAFYYSGDGIYKYPRGDCGKCGKKIKEGSEFMKLASLAVVSGKHGENLIGIEWAELCESCSTRFRKMRCEFFGIKGAA